MTRLLRLVDSGLNFVKMLETDEAEAMIASGKVEVRQMRKRQFILVLLDKRLVTEFRRGSSESSLGGAALQSIYRETHKGMSIAMQKRVTILPADKKHDAAAPLHKWDNELRFDELRAGQLVSQAAREKQKLAEFRRQNLVMCLANKDYRGGRAAA